MVKSSKKVLAVLLAVACLITFMPAMASQSFAAKKLTVKPAKKTIYVKKSVTLKANQKVKWSASKSSLKVVKLTSKKAKSVKVTGKKAGKAVVTAKVGKQTKKVTITVKKAAVKTVINIDTSKVQTEYGLSTTTNKAKAELTKADLLNGVIATINGKVVTLTEDNVSIGEASNNSIVINDAAVVKAKTIPVTYTVKAADGTVVTKTINITIKNQAPVVKTKDLTVATGTTIDENKLLAAVTSVDDYEMYPATTKESEKTVTAFTNVTDQTVKVTKVTDSTGKALTTISSDGKTDVVDINKIDTSKAGTYTIEVTATDSGKATGKATFKLTIQQNQAPTIDTSAVTVAKASTEDEFKANIAKAVKVKDAEDGEKALKDATGYDTAKVTMAFKDANGADLTFANTDDFYNKLASVEISGLNNIKDSNNAGINLVKATVPVKTTAGLVLTASNQTVNVDASATTALNLLQYITATYDGQAYALYGPKTVAADPTQNTTVTIKKGYEDVTSIIPNKGGKYTVTYVVKYLDTEGKVVTSATKKITVSVIDKAKYDDAVAKINAISTATVGNREEVVAAATAAYQNLDAATKDAIPYATFQILKTANPYVDSTTTPEPGEK